MTYTPKPGSGASRALEVLREKGPMYADALAAAAGMKRTSLEGNLQPAIRAGAITRERVGVRARYSLPAPAAAPEPELQFSCCLWGDGDLDVFPTLVLDHPTGRPAFRITREQARELWALMMGGQA